MQALIVILWVFGSLFIYFIGMGLTKAIGLKAWGEPDTSSFSKRLWCANTEYNRGNPPMDTIAQIVWPITLLIWGLIGLWWVGQHSPELTLSLFKYIDKAFEEEEKRAKLKTKQSQKALPPIKPKKQRRKKRTPRSGNELKIYEHKDDD